MKHAQTETIGSACNSLHPKILGGIWTITMKTKLDQYMMFYSQQKKEKQGHAVAVL